MCGYSSEMDEDTLTEKFHEKASSSNRKNNKPLMEKRRRQRINDCLNQLKSLVLQAMNKDTTQYSKLEKADILEMTVKHLKLVQRQHVTAAMATDPNVISKYRAGYNECAAEVARYLDTVNGGNPDLKGRLLGYLGNTMMQFPVIPVYQGMMSPYHVQVSQMAASQLGGYTPSSQQYGGNQHGVAKATTTGSQYTTAQNYCTRGGPSPTLDKSSLLGHLPTSLHAMHTSHPVSPPPSLRRVPSPSDSDSGLSDRSSPMSHDENGNYAVFNINNQYHAGHVLKSEHSPLNYESSKVKTEPFVHPHSRVSDRNPKRKCDFDEDDGEDNVDVTSVKRRNTSGEYLQNAESVIRRSGQVPAAWRPW